MLLYIYEESKKQNKKVVAIGDVRYFSKYEKVFHEILINAKRIGGVRHPLFNYKIENPTYPTFSFLTTSEMQKQYPYLRNSNNIFEVVIKNSNYIADQIEEIEVIKDKLFTPIFPNNEELLKKVVFENARKKYGDELPTIVSERLAKELKPIIKHGYSVIYWISHLLVKKSLQDGYLVGSRGSVGSSLVATLANISEVNPLPPHYICEKCKHSEFFEESILNSGYDLDPKNCPNCDIQMKAEGQNIPFETFLGFNADKVPDIDLNFSGDYQNIIHQEVKKLFGEKHFF